MLSACDLNRLCCDILKCAFAEGWPKNICMHIHRVQLQYRDSERCRTLQAPNFDLTERCIHGYGTSWNYFDIGNADRTYDLMEFKYT